MRLFALAEWGDGDTPMRTMKMPSRPTACNTVDADARRPKPVTLPAPPFAFELDPTDPSKPTGATIRTSERVIDPVLRRVRNLT